MIPLELHPDRLFPADPATRTLARTLYATVRDLPIVSPHGHTDPQWYADDAPFADPSALFIVPDHYVFRMLYSHGVPRRDGTRARAYDPRAIWRTFAQRYHLFRGTPTRLWLDHAFHTVFGLDERLTAESADRYYDRIDACLHEDAFRPRALFERFNMEVIATTESPLDSLAHHRKLRDGGWTGRVVTAYRPDPVVDPQFEGFGENVARLAELTNEDTATWSGYLAAHRARRAFFRSMGATSTDHGHPTARTLDLAPAQCQRLLDRALAGTIDADEAESFRAQVLTEMARMSVDDGLVMQIHPGSFRNHNPTVFREFGRDKGADIPMRTDYVEALKPLLDRVGNEPKLTLILFTLDETTYARWRRSPVTTRRSSSARRGGSTTASRACSASSSRRSRRRDSRIPSASTTTRVRSCRFPRATMCGGASRAASSRRASSSIASARTRRWSSHPRSRATWRRRLIGSSRSLRHRAGDVSTGCNATIAERNSAVRPICGPRRTPLIFGPCIGAR